MRNNGRLSLLPMVTLIGAFGCEPGPPQANLEVDRQEGEAPLAVLLEATELQGHGKLSFRFDVDGDGEWDTDFVSEPWIEHVYPDSGSYRARVEVTDENGEQGEAELAEPVEVYAALANLSVDANRDGVLDGDDELDASDWSRERGAMFFANFDDDDLDLSRDFRDTEIDGEEDLSDMAPVLLRRAPALTESHRVELQVWPIAAADRVRLFNVREDGSYIVAHDIGEQWVEVDAESLRSENQLYFLEGAGSRDGIWDGIVKLTVRVRLEDEVVAEDTVALRVAPVLFPDNTRPAERLYVLRLNDWRFGDNTAFYNKLVEDLPAETELYTVNPFDYGGDRWVQDNMQTGYQSLPFAGGEMTMTTYLETERFSGDGLEYLVPYELMTADFGFAYPGGEESSLNSGGNLEIAPPLSANGVDYPFGRVLVGGGSQGLLTGTPYADHMTAPQLAFLNAQELQGTAVELSTEWLAVGHIDEYFLFIPDASRPERPWRVALASPTLARQALEDLLDEGQGDLAIFQGRNVETTVADILYDDELLAFNDAAQARIDSARDVLVGELGLLDEDFIEMPVLYEPMPYGGYVFAAAYNPGVQNMVVTNQTLFIPDPEGPRLRGEDVWQRQIVDGLEGTGNTVHFVDIFESYHVLLGEAHCGTNVEHSPFPNQWWQP